MNTITQPMTLTLPLRRLPWVGAGIMLMLLTLAVGVGARSLGPLTPEIGALTFFGPRVPVVETFALVIHYGFEPLLACILTASICLILLLVFRNALRAAAFGSITAIGWLASEVGKYTVFRPRPPHAVVHSVIVETATDSFPSGHTSFVFSLVCAVVLVLTKPGTTRRLVIAAGIALVATVAVSRIYLGLHYPSDVVGSGLISTAALFIWLPIWNRWIHPGLLRITLPPSILTLARRE